jgi:hypothetical protein
MASSKRHAGLSAALVMLVLRLCTVASAVEFAGGDGTFGNPFQITNARQLLDIGSNPQLLNQCFVLNNDIDFDSHYGPLGTLAQAAIAPASSSLAFEGWLDGRGHVIRHLRIKAGQGNSIGLIGRVGAKGTIVSLGVEQSAIYAARADVGLLAGSSAGTILGCWAEGQVHGSFGVGLLVGRQEAGTIAYGYSEGFLVAVSEAGGSIGEVVQGEVQECSSDCRIETGQGEIIHAGGLVGTLGQGTVTDSFARASIVCPQGTMLGGLVGDNTAGTIRACLSLGSIKGKRMVGGLVGRNGGTIRSCYSRCTVEAQQYAGGLVCTDTGTIMLCYAAGPVRGSNVGGLMMWSRGAYLSYWDVDKSGVSTSGGGFGRTAAQMQQAATFRGWGHEREWVLPEGDMPRLWWEPCWGSAILDSPTQFSGGSGTEEDPYEIQTASEFASLAWDASLLDKHFVLSQDVNLAGLDSGALLPIGTRGLPFCGSLDGQGHVLSGFACNLSVTYAGLFGCVGVSRADPNQTGWVKNLVLREAKVTGRETVGALAACLEGGRIEACFITGQVQGTTMVGGAIGELMSGEMVESAFDGRVSGHDRVGGLVGTQEGIVRSCYSACQVVGETSCIGGLAGELYRLYDSPSPPLIAFCYSEAQVNGGSSVGGLVGSVDCGEVFACYARGKVQGHAAVGGVAGVAKGMVGWGSVWDRQSTAANTSAFGQSQTTLAMMDSKTYPGWEYGRQWTLKAGADYPRLAWEDRAGPLMVDPIRAYGGGSGTYSDPYLIGQGEHLVTLSRHPQDFGRHFRLTRDIDLQAVQASLSPIGTPATPFTGSFDGNYHTLKNLKHVDTAAGYVGLFRSIRRSSETGDTLSGLVSSLHLESADIKAAEYVGALAGHNAGEILFCTVSQSTVAADQIAGGLVGHNAREGTLLACDSGATVALGGVVPQGDEFENAGGLVALNEGTLLLCSSSADVRGLRDMTPDVAPRITSRLMGGLVGTNEQGTITGCTSTAHVVGLSTVGGLVGSNDGGRLYRCGAIADVDVRFNGGGFAGESHGGSIKACFARGKVAGSFLGGFIYVSEDTVIESCYFEGSITGEEIGGFAGSAYGQSRLTNCYCAASIQSASKEGAFVRGLDAPVQMSSCFWDKTVFPDSRNMQYLSEAQKAGVTGLDTQSLQNGQKLREAGWDFVGTWVQCAGGYPHLWWEQVACGE